MWEGLPNPLPRPLLWTVPPLAGCCGVAVFRVSFSSASAAVAVGAFCSESVRFVAVHDVSGVPADNVVWSELAHFGECHLAMWASVVGLCVCGPSDQRRSFLVVRCVVVADVFVAHPVCPRRFLTVVVDSSLCAMLLCVHV